MPMTGYESALAQGMAEVVEIREQIKKLHARLETIDKLVAILNLLIPQPEAILESAPSHEMRSAEAARNAVPGVEAPALESVTTEARGPETSSPEGSAVEASASEGSPAEATPVEAHAHEAHAHEAHAHEAHAHEAHAHEASGDQIPVCQEG